MSSDEVSELYRTPAVEAPSVEALVKMSAELGLDIAEVDMPQYQETISKFLKSYDTIDSLPEPLLPVKYPRIPGYKPNPADNPLNAWAWRCDIKGADSGKLSGLKVGVKNNISVAGVPMTNGSRLLDGYVPEVDATVITRILDQGGNITGMTNCENLCFSGSSFTNAGGTVLNPHDPTRSSGGSSSGSAVAVATGEVDVALGGDQGGSIRIPSCWCGVVGLKPTFGLVPYTGICSLEGSVDHVGPIAKDVQHCALLLEAIAGYDDGLDHRQRCDITVPEYTKLLSGDVKGMKVALIQEGFENCEPDVVKMVKAAADSLVSVGVSVENISFPPHTLGATVWTPICMDGFYATLMKNYGVGTGHKGFYQTSLIDKLAPAIKAEPHHFSEVVKMTIMMTHHIDQKHHGRFYAKAQNQMREITKQFDDLLTKYDALIMPTLPYKTPKLPTSDSTITDRFNNALGMIQNTAPYNGTGHPAINVPCGKSEGLPVGMMIVGGQFQEVKILNIAKAYETIRDAAQSKV